MKSQLMGFAVIPGLQLTSEMHTSSILLALLEKVVGKLAMFAELNNNSFILNIHNVHLMP